MFSVEDLSTTLGVDGTAYHQYSSIISSQTIRGNLSTVTTGVAAPNGGTDIDRLIWAYCSPPIFILGIMGNVLTVLVTSRRPTRNTSSGVYLMGMSLAAIGVYLFGFLSQWLRACGFVDLVELDPWSCRFNKFIYYSSGDVAIWILSLLNVDRLVAVCFPLRKADICTRCRAISFTIASIVIAIAKNLHLFWTRGTVYNSTNEVQSHCGAPHPHTDFEKFVRPWIVFGIVTIFPVGVIITCNALIIRKLARGRTIRRNVTGKRKPAAMRMTTTMCIGASLSFVFFTSPSIILVVLQPYYPGDGYDIAKAVNNLLVHVNYAANFFLYCLGGHGFRMRLRMILIGLCCRRRGRGIERFRFDGSMSSSTSSSTIRGHRIRNGLMEVTAATVVMKTCRSDSSTFSGSTLSNV